ncbi:MAG: alpha-2-macroglobulin [Syntrophobacteraceae bacterium]
MPSRQTNGRSRFSFFRSFRLLFLAVLVCAVAHVGTSFGAAFDSTSDQPPVGSPLKLLRITPAGDDVPPGQEIVFQFDRPVVPLGRMERNASEIPITITPALSCQWRWLNPSALACRLDKKDKLREATRYSIVVNPGIKAEDGGALSAAVTHGFVTERPKVSYSSFKMWQAPGQPVIAVHFNQAVEEPSVAKSFYFHIGDGARVDVQASEDPDLQQSKDYKRGFTWLLTPKIALPLDRGVQLQVEPGLIPMRGGEPGIDRRTIETFHTFPELKFLGVECLDVQGKTISIRTGSNLAQQPRCAAPYGVSLLFSSPVSKDEVKRAIVIEPPPRRKTEEDPWEDVYTDSRLSEPHQKTDTYQVQIPEPFIRPYTQYRLRAPVGSMKDEFGRPLSGAIDMAFMTDHLAPDLTLPRRLPVLEKGLDTDVAIYSTNLSKIRLKYETAGPGAWNAGKTKQLTIPAAKDVVAPIPLNVRSLIGKPSGLLQGHLTHEPRPKAEEQTPLWFLAQVTPFHVHVKLGHFNTLVWVTDLQSGEPVPNVDVSVIKGRFDDLGFQTPALAKGTTNGSGVVTLPGTRALDPQLELYEAFDPDQPRLIFRCERGGDIAVLPLSYDFSVAAEGSNHDYIPEAIRPKHGHLRSWGTTAQGIYKLGDTVQYKIYVRDQDNQRFVSPPGATLEAVGRDSEVRTPAAGSQPGESASVAPALKTAPAQRKPEPVIEPAKPAESLYTLKVYDPGDKVIFERSDVRMSAFGAMDGELVIPKTGTVGWYRFTLSTNFTKDELEPMRVLVSDFTPAPFKVTTDLKASSFGPDDPVTVETRATLHAGGPYTRAKSRITALLKSEPFTPGHPASRGFEFDVVKSGEYETPPISTIFETRTVLDDQGVCETRFEVPDSPILYGRLSVESAVQDDRGKHVANRASATYFGRNLYVGLSQTGWLLEEGRPADTRVIVVNRDGEPVPGVRILATVERRETKAARVKDAGDAYVPQYVHEWVAVESRDLVSASDPVSFDWKPPQAGYYRITARIGKEGGEAPPDPNSEAAADGHQSSIHRYVTGKSFVLWDSVPGNLLDVKPEKETVKIGETARFLVQNPFPGMKGLISIERYGVMESWVKTFETSTEVIEIPVKPEHLPGFYLSVMVISPRVDKPVSEEGEDLGKPTFRMGYAQIKVRDAYKEISVQARPQREVFKPRDTVSVDLETVVKHPSEEGSRPPIELAVAVLDEAVFDLLAGRKVFDPYEGFYTLDPMDLTNYNLIMQLVGRQELEKKGADPGGGGGPDLAMRSVFKFVSYWNPSLPVDKDGKARIEFEVPDNLTGWRILAMAVTPDDRMGLGEGTFKVNQPTEIRPVLPNQVLEGDRFEAGFSIMNRTDAPRTLQVSLEARGPVREQATAAAPQPAAKVEGRVLASQTIQVDPFKRVTVRIPVETAGSGTISFSAQAGDDGDRDSVRFQVPVLRRQAREVAAVYGTTTSPEASENVLFPDNMLAEYSQLDVSLSSSAIGGLEGAFSYLRSYPYSCWEQKLTKGVMAAFFKQLKPYISQSFEWKEADGLPAKTLQLAAEYQAPNGGMAYYAPKDNYVDPYLSAYTALAFGWLRTAGFAPPQPVEAKLHGYLEALLQRNVNAEFYTKGMMATVRATAIAALAEAGKLQKTDLERFENAIPEMSLFGKALFLQASVKVPGASRIQQKLLTSLLAQASQSAGTLFFTETLDSRFRCLLTSTVRDNAALLSALLGQETSPGNAQSPLRDIPLRLMRALTQARKGRDRWSSTQDNVFVVRALADFSRVYEKTAPAMTVQTSLDQERFGKAELKTRGAPPAEVEYRPKASDVGRKAKLRIERSGEGRLYYGVNLRYETAPVSGAAAEDAPTVNAGIEVHREYSVERDGKWVLLGSPAELKTGELVRVDLYVGVPAERHFVVVQDPLPGGLEPVNRDLATASTVDAKKSEPTYAEGSYRHRQPDWLEFGYSRWSFYFRELRHDAARFYSEILPAGHYHLSYVAQAIAPGVFTAQSTHVEEMYDPDVFGKGRPIELRIQAAGD